MDNKTGKIRKIGGYVLSAALAVVLMYFSFRDVKWADFLSTLQNCRWGYIVASMLAGVLAFWFRALRWRELLLPIDPSMTRLSTFNGVNIGYIANFVFPRIGEFVRCGVITANSRDKKASYDKVLGTVVLERSTDLLMMFGALLLLLLARWQKFGAFFIDSIWKPMVSRFDTGAIYIAIVAAVLLLAAASLIVWFSIKYKGRYAISSKLYSLAKGLLDGLGSCLKMERKWPFFIYSILIWVMYWLMSFFTMNAIPSLQGLSGTDALFFMLAGSLGWLVPVPGGFGAFHYIVALAVSTVYMLPFDDGIIFATLSHEAQAVTMILFGLLSFLSESFRRRER